MAEQGYNELGIGISLKDNMSSTLHSIENRTGMLINALYQVQAASGSLQASQGFVAMSSQIQRATADMSSLNAAMMQASATSKRLSLATPRVTKIQPVTVPNPEVRDINVMDKPINTQAVVRQKLVTSLPVSALEVPQDATQTITQNVSPASIPVNPSDYTQTITQDVLQATMPNAPSDITQTVTRMFEDSTYASEPLPVVSTTRRSAPRDDIRQIMTQIARVKDTRLGAMIEADLMRAQGAVATTSSLIRGFIQTMPDGFSVAMKTQIIEDELLNNVEVPQMAQNVMDNAHQITRQVAVRPMGRAKRRSEYLGRQPTFRTEPLTQTQLVANNPTKELSARQPWITSSNVLRTTGNYAADMQLPANNYVHEVAPVQSLPLNRAVPPVNNQPLQQTLDITNGINRTISMITTSAGQANAIMNNMPSTLFESKYNASLVSDELNKLPEAMEKVNVLQDRLNESSVKWQTSLNNIASHWRSIAGMSVAGFSIPSLMKMSDTVAAAPVRMSMAVENIPNTTEGDYNAETIARMQESIYRSSLNTGTDYTENMRQFSRMGLLAGDAFNSADEMMAFMDLLNKSFAIGMSSSYEQQKGRYQITQALGFGKLQGEDFRSIGQATPEVLDRIEDYFKLQGVEKDLFDLRSSGEITADVMKAAFLTASDDINKSFEKVPMTWERVQNNFKTVTIKELQPVLSFIGTLAKHANTVVPIFAKIVMAMIAWKVATMVGHGAMVAYNAVLMAGAIRSSLLGVAEKVRAGATLQAALATQIAGKAEAGKNAQMLAGLAIAGSVVGVILLVVAAVYGMVWAWNKATGATVSATGVIFGAVWFLVAAIANIFIWLVNKLIAGPLLWLTNAFAGAGEQIEIIFNTAWAGVLYGAQGMVKGIEDMLRSISFGKLDFNWSESLNGEIDKTAMRIKDLENLVKEKKASVPTDWNYLDYMYGGDFGAAYTKGYEFGQGIDATVGSWFNESILSGADLGLETDGLLDELEDINNNTGNISDSVSMTETDLKYLRDLAEREAINRYTTASIVVRQNNVNNIAREQDLDGILSAFTEDFARRLENHPAGVPE